MKRVFFAVTVVALFACNWDDAEKKARCARDPGCSSVFDGGTEDGGMTDAGPRSRSVFYPQTSTFYSPDPIGLYAARDGGFWVDGNVDDVAIVELRNNAGELVHDLRFSGIAISAYANAAVDPALAVLRDAAGEPELVIFGENGNTRGVTNRYGRIVSVYGDNVGSKTSVWDVSDGLAQHIFVSNDVSYSGLAGQTPCNIDFTDLEVLPPSSGGSVAIVYFANACDAGVVTEGIVPNRKGGVQLITPAGVRSSGDVMQAQAVGGSLDGQLRFITKRDDANITIFEGSIDGGALELRQSRLVASTGNIFSADVHDDYVTFAARGSLQTDTVLTAGPSTSPDDAIVAHIAPWAAIDLGKTDDARMPVLHLGNDEVWVLWTPRDGGMQLTNLTWSLDGGFVVH